MNPLTVSIIHALTTAVFPIISAIVAAFVVILLRTLAKKLHISLSTDTVKILEGLAVNGVGIAEELAVGALKTKGIKITSNGKLDIAVAHIIDALPTISRSTAEEYVHATLAKISGVGATGDKKL